MYPGTLRILYDLPRVLHAKLFGQTAKYFSKVSVRYSSNVRNSASSSIFAVLGTSLLLFLAGEYFDSALGILKIG